MLLRHVLNYWSQNPINNFCLGFSGTGERRVRKRSKWLQSTTSSAPSSSSSSMSHHFNKDSTFLKRIVTEVIAERDAQIAAALFEVAKNQPHLQMMVQTVRIVSRWLSRWVFFFFLSFFLVSPHHPFFPTIVGTQVDTMANQRHFVVGLCSVPSNSTKKGDMCCCCCCTITRRKGASGQIVLVRANVLFMSTRRQRLHLCTRTPMSRRIVSSILQ